MDTNPTFETVAKQVSLIITVLEGVDIFTDEAKQAMKELRETDYVVPREPAAIASPQSLFAQVELLYKVLEGVQISPKSDAPSAFLKLKESLSIRCPLCHRTYARWPHVRRHIILSKEEQHMALAIQLKSTICDICGLDLGKSHLKTIHLKKCRPTGSTPSEHPNAIGGSGSRDPSALRTQSDASMGGDSESGDQSALRTQSDTPMGGDSDWEDQPPLGTRPDTSMGSDSGPEYQEVLVDTRDSPGCLSVREVYIGW